MKLQSILLEFSGAIIILLLQFKTAIAFYRYRYTNGVQDNAIQHSEESTTAALPTFVVIWSGSLRAKSKSSSIRY
jgi:hypothetical protein